MKLTFGQDTFAAWSFRCLTLVAVQESGPPYRAVDGQATGAGLLAGDETHPGANIGQDFHTGAIQGHCNA